MNFSTLFLALHFCVRLVIQDNVRKRKKDHPFYTWPMSGRMKYRAAIWTFFKAHACSISFCLTCFIAGYVNTGCWVFKQGVQNCKDFCLKINIPKGNYWILRIGVMERCQNLTFKVNFLHQKSSESFSILFHWRILI